MTGAGAGSPVICEVYALAAKVRVFFMKRFPSVASKISGLRRKAASVFAFGGKDIGFCY